MSMKSVKIATYFVLHASRCVSQSLISVVTRLSKDNHSASYDRKLVILVRKSDIVRYDIKDNLRNGTINNVRNDVRNDNRNNVKSQNDVNNDVKNECVERS